MPAPTLVTDFLDCVRKSTVVEPKDLDNYLARVGARAPDTPARMADALVAEGLITRFQGDQMLRGRWRNFILGGKYTILEPLGAGGMGTVYLCSHRVMRRPVAVKVLPAVQADDPGAVERFQREAQAVAQLRHPNIVGAHDIDRDGKFHFFVMEYIDGVNLQELVKRSGPLNPERAAHYMHQAALGLQHAHEEGLVHRDVKPANLLVDRTGVVKILDLGLARFFHDKKESVTQKYDGNAVLGTADYLSPEQAVDSHNADIRCDIYSLGITFYFLLAGHSPFQDGSVAEKLIWHQVRQPKPIREIRPDVPEGLAAVLEKMIAKEPARRYQTPAELAEALAPYTQTAIEPPSDNEIPSVSPAARVAGFTEVNHAIPRLPSPNTPTPAPAKPASCGALRPQPSTGPDETNGRKDDYTGLITGSPATMVSSLAAPSSHREVRASSVVPRRPPWLLLAGAVLAALLLAGLGLAVVMSFLRAPLPTPPIVGASIPPNTETPTPIGAAEGVSIQKEADGLHVRTAKYEALIEPTGCLDSLRVGGVEFLKPGEKLPAGVTVAHASYFFSVKDGRPGVVALPDVRQTAPNIVTARGDKFDVKYEFDPDGVTLMARNSTDDAASFFILLNTAAVTDVVDGQGERLAAPVLKDIKDPIDPKWSHTTWIAGRSRLKLTCQDAGGAKIWGPFGVGKSQVWQTEVGTYQTAKIHLEPSVAAEEEKVVVPPSGVLLTRQLATRRAQTDLYEAVVEGDGCLTHLRVDGVEFLEPRVGISRGAYFYQKDAQKDAQKLPDILQPEPRVITAQGVKAAIRYEFGPDKMVWSLENKTDAVMAFYAVFNPAVNAVKNAAGEWNKFPITSPPERLDPKWATTTWYAGRAWIRFTGGTRFWGPWMQKYQVWETTLAPHEKRVVTVEVGLSSKEETEKAAAKAGVQPVLPSDVSLLEPLDYQVFQRKTRLQGAVKIQGRMRAAFDHLEYRLSGKPLEGAVPDQWQALPAPSRAKTFDASLPTPAGGWYKLEVRAMRDGKEVAHAAVDHVGVGEVFVGAGQSNSTNCAELKIQQTSNMVSTFSGTDWRLADDPQPGCHDGTTGGSFWPAFGDAMVEKYHVPIGVAVTGHTGSSVNEWQPGGELFLWTVGRMNQLGREGFRAVLWHQGESDVGMKSEEYGRKMAALIEESRKAAGWDVPWFVAQVSYNNPKEAKVASTREAQQKLWESGVALEGPDTDTLTGDNRDRGGQGVHFSPKGLRAHGRMWAEKVGVWLDKVLAK